MLQIKCKLGIEGILTDTSIWRHAPGKEEQEGAQIDFLTDRNDHSINVCEIKFYKDQFVIDKNYAGELNKKINVCRKAPEL